MHASAEDGRKDDTEARARIGVVITRLRTAMRMCNYRQRAVSPEVGGRVRNLKFQLGFKDLATFGTHATPNKREMKMFPDPFM